MTFGFTELMKGFDFIIAVIGLFGIGEILLSVEEGLSFQAHRTGMNLRVVLRHLEDFAALLRGPSCAAPSSASGWGSSPAGPRPPPS